MTFLMWCVLADMDIVFEAEMLPTASLTLPKKHPTYIYLTIIRRMRVKVDKSNHKRNPVWDVASTSFLQDTAVAV